MSYRTGPGVPRSLSELWQFVRREFGAIQREAVRVDTKAQNALEDLTLISDDGKLHPNEKLQVVLRYAQLTGEQSGLEARADSFGITTEKTVYSTALSDLTNYLNGLTPLWTDATQVTPIDREEWNGYWVAVTDARQALQNKISARAGEEAKWSEVANDNGQRPEDGATVGATAEERAQIRSMRNTFLEAFSDAGWKDVWQKLTGAGSLNLWSGAAATLGGSAAMFGSSATSDGYVYAVHPEQMPFDPNKLYRMEVRAFVYNEGDTDRLLYLGLFGYDRDGNYCNTSGANSFSSQHYIAAIAANTLGSWQTYVAYFKGNAAGNAVYSGAVGGNHIGNPAQLQANVRYIAPLIIANSSAKNGRTLVDYIKIDSIEVQSPRDLPMVQSSVAGVPTTPDYLTASDAGSSATVTIDAHTVQFGSTPVNYAAGSVSGLSYSTTYYIYCDDPGHKGGSVAYFATTSFATANGSDHRRPVGKITTPASGGGSVTPENPWCVVAGMWLTEQLRVDDARVGDVIDAWDEGYTALFPRTIEAMQRVDGVPCVLLTSSSGAQKAVSAETPVTTEDGRSVDAAICLGERIAVQHSGQPLGWETITEVADIGPRTVYKISLGGISLAGGVDPHHRLITHNERKP